MVSSTCRSACVAASAVSLSIATALVLSGPARAADKPPPATASARATARAKLVEGVELLHRDDYAHALARFQEAYALVPSPNIHYDIGLAYMGLDQNAAALRAFEAFLAHADQPPAGTREKAEAYRRLLRTRVATVEITADQNGAEVLIEGRLAGTTPLAGNVYVDPGWREVVVRHKASGGSATERFAATAGQRIVLSLHLVAPPAAPPPAGVAAAPVAPAAGPPPIRAASGERSYLGRWALASVGLGVALIGAGATFGVLTLNEANSLSKDSRDGTPPMAPVQFAKNKEIDGLRYQTLEIAFLATGAAAVVGGAVLWAVAGPHRTSIETNEARARPAGPSVSAVPILSPSLTGVAATLDF